MFVCLVAVDSIVNRICAWPLFFGDVFFFPRQLSVVRRLVWLVPRALFCWCTVGFFDFRCRRCVHAEIGSDATADTSRQLSWRSLHRPSRRPYFLSSGPRMYTRMGSVTSPYTFFFLSFSHALLLSRRSRENGRTCLFFRPSIWHRSRRDQNSFPRHAGQLLG